MAQYSMVNHSEPYTKKKLGLDEDGKFLIRRRVPPPKDNYGATIELIGALVEDADYELGATCPVGFSIPGTISPATGLIKDAFNSLLNGHAFDQDLAEHLSKPVKMLNDANCFVISKAKNGATACQKILSDHTNGLARALSSVINVIDPDVIVLGVELSIIQSLYQDVPKIWEKWVFSVRVDTLLELPVFGDSSGVRGAACLWDRP